MIEKQDYPILEFDPERIAVIDPSKYSKIEGLPEHCVITFFREVIEDKHEQGLLSLVTTLQSESMNIPVYKTIVNGKPICLVLGYLGAPASAGELEQLVAYGCKHFIVCGGAGVLQENFAVGHFFVPDSAVRDEGTSYHYLPPSREVACPQAGLVAIERVLQQKSIPYLKSKTWTTDAFFRETRDKVNLRISEGCVTVEMETAALFAVAQFRGVDLAQIIYGGDDLSGEQWDDRGWKKRSDVRMNLVDICMEICLEL